MSSLNLDAFSKAVKLLLGHAVSVSETTGGLACFGDICENVLSSLEIIQGFVQEYDLQSIRLTLDENDEEWDGFDFREDTFVDWKISIGDKQEVLKACDLVTADIDVFLFFDLNYFKGEWLPKASGLVFPERSDVFSGDRHIKIFVYGLEASFGGPRIAVVPVEQFELPLPDKWMQSTRLPNVGDIQKCIHLVTHGNVILSPEKMLMTWGDIQSPVAEYFLKASAVSLLMAVCQEYFGHEKVVLKGSRRLEIKLYSDLERQAVSVNDLESLIQTVEWCFAEHDESTRILLIVERISLDVKEGEDLISSIGLFKDALLEAKERYRYVVLDRKKDYTKELADLQKDISSVVDKISGAASVFSSSLLRDILALSFVLTAGVAARRFVNEEVISSPEASVLFKAFAIYLGISLALRWFHTILVVWQADTVFKNWQVILRSHMSKEELNRKINDSLFPVRVHRGFR